MWITLQPSDLDDYLVGAQVTALRTAALSSGQDDPVAQAIADITAEVRNHVASCSSYRLSADPTTIPPELKRHAIALVIEAAQPRIKIKLSEDQVRAATRAWTILGKVASCAFTVSEPADPQPSPTDQTATPKPSIAQNQTHRTRQNGI